MRLTPPSDIQVVKKEDKEAKIGEFITRSLERREANGINGSPSMTVVARSTESPVMRSLATHAAGLRNLGFEVRVIISALDLAATDLTAEGYDFSYASGGVRLLSDTRLYEAHEQLTIDGTSVWIGDCMRREAAKRDAYERYSEDCAETRTFAATAFDNLWRFSTPFSTHGKFKGGQRFGSADMPGGAMGQGTDGENAPMAATRH